MVFWFARGPLLAVLPMSLLLSSAVTRPSGASLARVVIIGVALAAVLGAYTARRAGQRRSS